jgi:dipeptidyl aminopeptidase/acylaminoacyl peptidase
MQVATVLDTDYRGSDGYGRILEPVFTVYGRKDLSDQIDGKNT